jgi:hypothetical protein
VKQSLSDMCAISLLVCLINHVVSYCTVTASA